MTLNNIEIERIVEELDLSGAYLQKIKAVNYETFIFLFYKKDHPINILVSTDRNCRIHRVENKKSFLGKPHNLVEYIKATLVGGRVLNISQVNGNRIVRIEIQKDSTLYNIYIRLWGGFPNIVITDSDNLILHLHRKSSKKNELPGELFSLPSPKPDKKEYTLKEHSFKDYNSFIENEFLRLEEIERKNKEELKLLVLRRKREKQLENLIGKLKVKLEEYKKSDRYKLYGDLIISNIYKINKGDLSLKTEDYENNPIEIPLDPKLEPYKNSDIYYKKFKKSLSGIESVNSRLKELERELNNPEFSEVVNENKAESENKTERPGLYYSFGKWEFFAGRNARENEELFRKYAKGNDMWLHVRDYPGGWVFIKQRKNKTFPLEVLIAAGNLALYYSKAKSNGQGDIMYTMVKNLRKVKNGKPGEVIASNNKNLFIKLDNRIIEKMKA